MVDLCRHFGYWLYCTCESCVVWRILNIQMSLGFIISNFWICTLHFLPSNCPSFSRMPEFTLLSSFESPPHCCCCRITAEWKQLSGKLTVRKVSAEMSAVCFRMNAEQSHSVFWDDSLNILYFEFRTFFIYSYNDELLLETVLLIFRECYIYIYWR